MWDFYGFLENVKSRIVLLRKRLANPFWGRKVKLAVALALSKAENTLEAMVFHLYKNQVAHRLAPKLPASTLPGIIDTIMRGESLFWFIDSLIRNPETTLYAHDVPDKRKLYGEIFKFATPMEVSDFTVRCWFISKVKDRSYILHPSQTKLCEFQVKNFLGIRKRFANEPSHAVNQIIGFDYDKYFVLN